jgi:hypothetical protein
VGGLKDRFRRPARGAALPLVRRQQIPPESRLATSQRPQQGPKLGRVVVRRLPELRVGGARLRLAARACVPDRSEVVVESIRPDGLGRYVVELLPDLLVRLTPAAQALPPWRGSRNRKFSTLLYTLLTARPMRTATFATMERASDSDEGREHHGGAGAVKSPRGKELTRWEPSPLRRLTRWSRYALEAR